MKHADPSSPGRRILRLCLRVQPLVAYQRRLLEGVAGYLHENALGEEWDVEYQPFDPPDAPPSPGSFGLIRQFDDAADEARSAATVPAAVGVLARWYDRPEGQEHVPHVTNDDLAVGRLAAEHLLDSGLRSFGWFSPRTGGPAALRREGFAGRLAEAGHPCSFSDAGPDPRGWVAKLQTPVGVMAFNDLAARELLWHCRHLGLRVPGEVAVVGVDDDPLFCAFSSPPLSSIVTGTHRIGYLAAEIVHRRWLGEEVPEDPPPVPPVRLVVRQSSDLLAVEDADVAAALRTIRGRACAPGASRWRTWPGARGWGGGSSSSSFRRSWGTARSWR